MHSLGILKIFITTGCHGCKRALELAEWVKVAMPRLVVRIIDLAKEPDAGHGLVFAVPTYVYNSKTIFLGNPSQQELRAWLDGLVPEV